MIGIFVKFNTIFWINKIRLAQGIKICSFKELGVIIMEPLRGAACSKAPSEVEKIWTEAKQVRTPQSGRFVDLEPSRSHSCAFRYE